MTNEYEALLTDLGMTRAEPMQQWIRVRDAKDSSLAWREWLRDESAMRGLVRHPDFEAIVDEVAEVMTARRAQALRRRVRASSADLRVVDPHDPPPSDGLPDDAPDVPIPAGYRVEPGGVWRQDDEGWVRLSHAAMLVEARYTDVTTGDAHVRVGWATPSGGWASAVVPRRTIADSRALVSLADRGAPVVSAWATAVSVYLAEQEAILPAGEAVATHRCGWHGRCYQWGDTTIPGPAQAMLPEDEVADIIDGLHARGTWDGWCGVVERVADRPHAWLAVYAGVASALMEPLGLDTGCVVSLVAHRATGKTSCVRLAASVWGRATEAGGIIRSWEATPYGIEQAASVCSGLGLVLDETSRVQARYAGHVASVVYALANGAGKQRGGSRRRTWRLVTMSTGEVPLRSYGGLEGAASRTIEVHGAPMPDAATAQAVEVGCEEHYGHLGPRVVEWLAARPWDGLRERYRERRGELQEAKPGLERAARSVALLEAAAGVVHALGVPQPTCDVWGWLWRELERHAVESDQAAAAWDALWGWVASEVIAGRLERTADRVVPWATARAVLERAGYSPSGVAATWRERGWVEVDGAGRLPKRHFGPAWPRCVVATDDADSLVGG